MWYLHAQGESSSTQLLPTGPRLTGSTMTAIPESKRGQQIGLRVQQTLPEFNQNGITSGLLHSRAALKTQLLTEGAITQVFLSHIHLTHPSLGLNALSYKSSPRAF